MTDAEKKLLQAQHRLEEAQARDRVKERKARTRRLIQEGAILEKVLPEVRTMELSALEDYLMQKLAQTQSESAGRSPGNRGPSSFSSRKGALTHHPEGAVVLAVRQPCALRGGLRLLRTASRQCHSTCGCCCHRLRDWSNTVVSVLETACNLPAQTCHRQLCLRLWPEARLRRSIFSFAKEKQKKKERGERRDGDLSSGSEGGQPGRRTLRRGRLRLSELFPSLQRLRRDTA